VLKVQSFQQVPIRKLRIAVRAEAAAVSPPPARRACAEEGEARERRHAPEGAVYG